MLNQAGFEVVMAFDLTRDIMKQTVEEFAARVLEKGNNTIAMVYYAGHGIQADGENYLIPIGRQVFRRGRSRRTGREARRRRGRARSHPGQGAHGRR